jgi:hypothetical protein
MKRPGDRTPDPPGGRAAERWRLFERARRAPGEGETESDPVTPAKSPLSKTQTRESSKPTASRARKQTRRRQREKPVRKTT